jgi:hypothetical protein
VVVFESIGRIDNITAYVRSRVKALNFRFDILLNQIPADDIHKMLGTARRPEDATQELLDDRDDIQVTRSERYDHNALMLRTTDIKFATVILYAAVYQAYFHNGKDYGVLIELPGDAAPKFMTNSQLRRMLAGGSDVS